MDPLMTVEQVLDDAMSGAPRTVMVVGARGTGKSRVAEATRHAAASRQIPVVLGRGYSPTAHTPFDGLQDLVRPYAGRLETLVPAHADVLRRLVSDQVGSLDPAAIRVAFMRFVAALSATTPTCLVIDDIDLMDRSSAEVVMFALARLSNDRVAAVVTARRPLDWPNVTSIVLDPLEEEHLTEVLADRGIAESPARACAKASRGVPGMAIALADGLTAAQRSGRERLPMMIRPARSLIEQQRSVLNSLPAATQRALVVVAADELGHLGAVRTALQILGEHLDSLDDAEAQGLIEIDGPTVRFTDPWWRPAAYYLVAPASRRAAHRALAESYAEPHQAEARAWQLAAAALGPCDRVAEALGLVAGDVARRGATVAAVETFARAAEFAETNTMREQLMLGALRTAVDGLELDVARDLAVRIEPISTDSAVAIADTLELAGVPAIRAFRCPSGDDGPWARRRHERIQLQEAARGGRHRDVIESTTGSHSAYALLSLAQGHRHAGNLSRSRDALTRIEAMATASSTELTATVDVLHADLDLLTGRFEDCTARLRSGGGANDTWTRNVAEWVRRRLDAATGIDVPAPWANFVAVEIVLEPLASVRTAIARGAGTREPGVLEAAVECAVLHELPIEAAEANLARVEMLAPTGDLPIADEIRAAAAELWRLGVHGWDLRISALEAGTTSQADLDLSRLSQAEMRVAEAIGAGMTNREAAAALFLSVKTIDFHLQQIYRKLNLRSRTELAVIVVGSDQRTRRRAG